MSIFLNSNHRKLPINYNELKSKVSTANQSQVKINANEVKEEQSRTASKQELNELNRTMSVWSLDKDKKLHIFHRNTKSTDVSHLLDS